MRLFSFFFWALSDSSGDGGEGRGTGGVGGAGSAASGSRANGRLNGVGGAETRRLREGAGLADDWSKAGTSKSKGMEGDGLRSLEDMVASLLMLDGIRGKGVILRYEISR